VGTCVYGTPLFFFGVFSRVSCGVFSVFFPEFLAEFLAELFPEFLVEFFRSFLERSACVMGTCGYGTPLLFFGVYCGVFW
jgi:hypothetical protein